MPKAQTVATEKYRKKAGIVTKSFKIKKEIADGFRLACKKAGVSQTGKIVELMEEFIERNK